MKKLVIFLVVCLTLVGCATSSQIRAENREKLLKLSPGMNKEAVLRVMGTKTIRAKGGSIITNPYRTEMYPAQGNVFELLFYYTDKKKSDGAITDDELTPLVLKDGRLDGWGWSYWNDLVKKYEIRVR